MALLPVLTFHAVDDQPSMISFPPQLFERSMALLYDRGFQALGLLEVVKRLRQGLPFPERSFAITFDDGYQSVYQHAFPILQRYGFSGTVFLAVGENGNHKGSERLPSMCERSMLSWREVKEMNECGITFGAHTLTHPDLTRLPFEKIQNEVYGSKAIIEDALGTQVACFAYPYGYYDDQCREVVSHHFICACSDTLGLVRAGSDPYAIERVDSYYVRSDRLFDVMLTSLFPWYVRLRSIPRELRRAIQSSYR